MLDVLAIGAWLAAAAPQDGPATPGQDAPRPQTQSGASATQVDDIIVTGRRATRSVVEGFVDEVIEAPRGRGPGRWYRRVCVGAVNLNAQAAQVLIDRVSTVAASVGLEPGEPGCEPNIVIIATDDADALTGDLIDMSPRAFRPVWSGAAQSPSALAAFRETDAPVRWWHVGIPVDRDSGQAAVRIPGFPPPVVTGGSRLTTNVTNRLLRSFVIVDVTRTGDASFEEIGDYVAMVALAQIDPQAEPAGYPTILNLFSAPERGRTMSRWDTELLAGLYDAEMRQRNPHAQLGEVAAMMTRSLRRPAEPETDEPDEVRPGP